MKIAIVNYGMGNIYSVKSALKHLGFDSILTNSRDEILSSNKIILPGVGSFRLAMQNIKKLELDKILNQAVIDKKKPILGICLGMQLLGVSSDEDGYTEGLNFFDGIVNKFDNNSLKIPHIGFNNVKKCIDSKLMKDIKDLSDFYFVHSYRMKTKIVNGISFCDYGEKFVAAFEKDNIFGTQFHPEKSQFLGLKLIENFLNFDK